MAKSKAAKHRKTTMPAPLLTKTASKDGSKATDMFNNPKAQKAKPVSATVRKPTPGFQTPQHKTRGSKTLAVSAPGNQKSGLLPLHDPKEAQKSPSAAKKPPRLCLNDHSLLEMRKAIALLFMLTQFPIQPSSNRASSSKVQPDGSATNRILTLAEEERLTGVFAFVASTTNDPRKVSALCLEQLPDGTALIVRIATNHGDLTPTKQGFENIARVLKATHEDPSPGLTSRLLKTIVVLNQNRILCRLQSCHAKWQSNFAKNKIARGPVLPRVVQLATISRTAFKQEIDDLRRCHVSLESLEPSHATSEAGARIISEIVQVIHSLLLKQDFRALLSATLRTRLDKIGRYVSATEFLIQEARRLIILAGLRVEVVTLEPVPQTTYVLSPQDIQSGLPRVDPPVDIPGLYRRLNGQKKSLPVAAESILLNRYSALVNAKCAVHAEMQLLFHYEFSTTPLPPRVILSTKKACYLCHAFFMLHGRFSIPMTHGRIYEKWTLPRGIWDLEGLKAQKMQKMQKTLEIFFSALREAIRGAIVLSEKCLSNSNESLFLRSSIWPATTDRLIQADSSSRALVVLQSRSASPLQEVVTAGFTSTRTDIVSAVPQSLLPPSPMIQEPSHGSSSLTASNVSVLEIENALTSFRLDEGTSVTLQIADSAHSVWVKTKSAHFLIADSEELVTSTGKYQGIRHQRYVKVEYLSQEQLSQSHHQLSRASVINLSGLVPDVDLVVDQHGKACESRGIYVSGQGSTFLIHSWDVPSTDSW